MLEVRTGQKDGWAKEGARALGVRAVSGGYVMGAPDLELLTAEKFFAPAPFDLVDGLMGRYRSMRMRIEQVSAMIEGETAGAMAYFLDAAKASDRHVGCLSVDRLFELKPAIAALDASYWSQAINLTDVLDSMPQARRSEWNESIREHKTPPFEEETVRATLQDLLMSRQKFFAERVDGIFRALSGEHVTNRPQGFGKRMILTGITNTYYSTERVGYINDLRCVIAKFMGRDEPEWNATGYVARWARRNRRGEWVTLDGGALRLRCYENGNAHIEVHPDMAWRLNCVLAQLYPAAIPSEFRQRPKKKPRDVVLMQRPLPFVVIQELEKLEPVSRPVRQPNGGTTREQVENALRFRCGGGSAHARNEAEQILVALGGVLTKEGHWQFDYNAADAIREICASGCVPDRKSHQFYPTPRWLAEQAVEWAEIGPHDVCLEPSAGTGAIADLLPVGRTACVEISPLHCKVLEAKGFRVECSDFLAITRAHAKPDVIVMNPPFDQGRWQAHVEHAASLLNKSGRLVAILPASARNADLLPEWACTWLGPFDNAFPGASVSVVALVAERI